ncbi:MAG TPA: hypothetical protein VGJ82_01475 [Thermoanaerobaculia bacterium]|jgi:hypothetical protein
MLTPAQRIFAGVLIGGAIGFLGGIVASFLLAPNSNLAPLAAFIITGPLGAIAGAVIADRENKLLFVLWSITLLLTFLFAIGPKLMAPWIGLQLLFSIAALRYRGARRWMLFGIFILAAVVSFFAPVAANGHFAGFASIFDRRLDASRHVPELVVARWLLFVELAIAAIIAAAINKSAAEPAALHRGR